MHVEIAAPPIGLAPARRLFPVGAIKFNAMAWIIKRKEKSKIGMGMGRERSVRTAEVTGF